MRFPAKLTVAQAAALQLAAVASVAAPMVGLALAASAGPAASYPHAVVRKAAPSSSANAIIQKMAAYYSRLSSLQVSIPGGMSAAMGGKKVLIPMRETLALQRPDKFAYAAFIASPLGNKTTDGSVANHMLSDGRHTIAYNELLKQYTSGPATTLRVLTVRNAPRANSTWAPAAALLLSLFSDPPTDNSAERLFGSAHLFGRKMLSGVPVQTLEFSSNGTGYFGSVRGITLYLAVDAATGRLIRTTSIIRGTYGVTVTENVQQIAANTPLPASLFTFHPPADVKLVDKFQPPSNSGADDAPTTAEKAPTTNGSSIVGKPAPDFSLQALNGKTIDLNSLKGRTILMDFSASW